MSRCGRRVGTAPLPVPVARAGLPLRTPTEPSWCCPPVQLTHAGVYDVVVTGACGEVTSAPAELVVSIVDSDGDGVPDAADGCPTTVEGCARRVRLRASRDTDSDGDGVADCLDRCPSTPAGMPVGPTGCPATDCDGNGLDDAWEIATAGPPTAIRTACRMCARATAMAMASSTPATTARTCRTRIRRMRMVMAAATRAMRRTRASRRRRSRRAARPTARSDREPVARLWRRELVRRGRVAGYLPATLFGIGGMKLRQRRRRG